MSAGEEFYLFQPDENLEGYELMVEAIEHLTENYWQHIGDEPRKALMTRGVDIAQHFRYSLMQAVEGTSQALTKFPRNSELPKLMKIFEHGMKVVGPDEELLISLIHGRPAQDIHSKLSDIYSEELYASAKGALEVLFQLRDPYFIGSVYRLYLSYHEHVKELISVYDEGLKVYSEVDGQPVKQLSELLATQEELLEEIWLSGSLRGEDYRLP